MMRSLFSIIALWLMPMYGMAQYEFIENLGQWNKKVLFKTKVDAGEVYLENDGIRFLFVDGQKLSDFHIGKALDSTLDCHAIKIEFQGSNTPSEIVKSYEGSTLYNFYKSKNKSKWVHGAKSFERIVMKNVYDGIDFELYSYQYKLKYNFYVHPGADPSQIRIKYLGADDVLEEHGNITVLTSLRTIIEEQPYAFQKEKNGEEKEVLTRFKLEGNELSFNIKGNYQRERTLVIDPSVVFATYSGSAADNFGYTATYDDLGNAYSGGTVYSFGFPVTMGAFQILWKGGVDVNIGIGDIERDIGILKYNADGSKIIYATLLGGTHNEDPHSMIVNNKDELLVFGNTGSSDFPTTINAYDTTYSGGYDIYVTKLSSDGGRLLASTFIGGTKRDGLNGRQTFKSPKIINVNPLGYNYGDLYRGEVIVDKADQVYIVSSTLSDDFPVSTNAYQTKKAGQNDGVVVKLSKDLSSIEAATYFGGKEHDAGYGLGLNHKKELLVCGGTQGFINIPGKAYQDTFQGGRADGIILKFGLDLDTLIAGTYFGTDNYDQTYLLQVDDYDAVYVTGQTQSPNFPLKTSKFVQKGGKQFISKFSSSLDTLTFSSTFGGDAYFPKLSPSAFLVDQCGRIYFSGWGGGANTVGSTDSLPVSDTSIAEKTTTDNADFYLAIFSRDMDSLEYGSYFGGNLSAEHVDGGTSRYSRSAVVYQSVCAGCGAGSSDDFPVTAGVVGPKNGTVARCNNALFKLNFESPVLFADFEIPDFACFQRTIVPENRSVNARSYEWDFGDGDTSLRANPTHTYADTGWYKVQLIVTNPQSCPGKDTFSKEIYIYGYSDASFNHFGDDCLRNYEFVYAGQLAQTFNWSLGDGWYSNFPRLIHQYQNTGSYTVRLITDSGTACADTSFVNIVSEEAEADFSYTTDSCETFVTFKDESNVALSHEWELEPGVFSTQNDPDYFYPAEGKYTVILRINEGKPCFDSVVKEIEVKTIERVAKFDLSIDSCSYTVELIDASTYTDGVTWITNDDTLRLPTKSYTYPKSGSFDIELIAAPFSLCPDTTTDSLSFEIVSDANFTISIDSCLSKVSTTNQSINAKTYDWFTGNITINTFEPQFSYGDTGTFSIMLVTNKNSICADTAIKDFSIDYVKLAQFKAEPIECTYDVVFTNTSENAVEYDWNFGNGETSKQKEPGTIAYSKPGDYDIELVIDPSNIDCADTFSTTITVRELPVADFDFKPEVCNSVIQFENKSSNFTTSVWTFDRADTAQRLAPIWNFNTLGEKTVDLKVTDDLGCEDSTRQSLTIDSLSKAAFTHRIDTCAGTLTLRNNSVDAHKFDWQINDEAISDKRNPGTWDILEGVTEINIQLTINDSSLCKDTLIANIPFSPLTIEDIFVPNIVTANGDGKNDLVTILGIPEECEEVRIIIYNRWGQKVYEFEGREFSWDVTTMSDREYANGTFYFLLEVNDEDYNGTFTVVR